ncbi:MAG TPA: DUF4129 domain-containing protein [Chitinophagaceae bacterium]|nr:DUF4129 domain-containing protein [Chitinophagaceae bacterium]
MIRIISYRLCSSFIAMCFLAGQVYSQIEKTEIDSVAQVQNAPGEYDDESPDDDESFYPDTLRPNFRSVVYDSILAIQADKGFYYKSYLDSLLRATAAKQAQAKRPVDLRGTGFFNSIFGIAFWILAIGLFGYLVYRLFLSNSALFARSRKNIPSDKTVERREDTNDPDVLLRNAIRSGNYRLAVRYLYLQVLNKLADRNIIEVNSNKTNYEYVNEMRKHKFANEFASLTLQYEYVWYGEYPVDEKLFAQIQGSFARFTKNLTR